jgi:hypothetical protein
MAEKVTATSFRRAGYEISVGKIPGRKSVALTVKEPKENVHYAVAYFNSEAESEKFIGVMLKVFGHHLTDFDLKSFRQELARLQG